MRASLLPSLIALSLYLCITLALRVSCVSAEQAAFSTPPSIPIEQHLSQANAALQSGRYSEALSAFDKAIQVDPTSWLTYYRRATAQLSLGRTSLALQDLATLLQLNPSFERAHLQRAKIFLKEGDLEKVSSELQSYDRIVKQTSSKDESAPVKSQFEKLTTSLSSLEKLTDQLNKHKTDAKSNPLPVDSAKLDQCVNLAGQVLQVSPNHLDTRLSRADCQLARGNLQDAMADWNRVVNLNPSPFLLRRLSSLSYFILGAFGSEGRDPPGLTHLKTCLRSDPDNRLCSKARRRLKNLETSLRKARNFYQANSYRAVLSVLKGPKLSGPTVLEEIQRAIQDDQQLAAPSDDTEPVIPLELGQDATSKSELILELHKMYCKSYGELNEIAKAMPFCEKVLSQDADNAEAITVRADSHMAAEQYEEAVRDYTKAFEVSGRSDRSILNKLQTAQKRLKLSQSKNYYKVLGVKRDDDTTTIKKAYRSLARENHPDKGGSQEKMAEINEAWGVLGDQELRSRYDMGDDPNDPMRGQSEHPFSGGGGGHPFEMFFQQQGGFGGHAGGGGHFAFKF